MGEIGEFAREIQLWNMRPCPKPYWWWAWKLVSRPFNALVYFSFADWLLGWGWAPTPSWEVWWGISTAEMIGLYCATQAAMCVLGSLSALFVVAAPPDVTGDTVLRNHQ